MGNSKKDIPYNENVPSYSDNPDFPTESSSAAGASASIPLLPTEHVTTAQPSASFSPPSYYEATSVPIISHGSNTNNPEAPPEFSEVQHFRVVITQNELTNIL